MLELPVIDKVPLTIGEPVQWKIPGVEYVLSDLVDEGLEASHSMYDSYVFAVDKFMSSLTPEEQEQRYEYSKELDRRLRSIGDASKEEIQKLAQEVIDFTEGTYDLEKGWGSSTCFMCSFFTFRDSKSCDDERVGICLRNSIGKDAMLTRPFARACCNYTCKNLIGKNVMCDKKLIVEMMQVRSALHFRYMLETEGEFRVYVLTRNLTEFMYKNYPFVAKPTEYPTYSEFRMGFDIWRKENGFPDSLDLNIQPTPEYQP